MIGRGGSQLTSREGVCQPELRRFRSTVQNVFPETDIKVIPR